MIEWVPSLIGQTFATIYGLVVGSFLAVCIVRMPQDRSLLVPSACPRCGARVRWRDNVPVLSWLLLRGRCRDCGTPISPLYPMVEALGGTLGWLLYRRLMPTVDQIDGVHAAAWVVWFVFLGLLVVAAAVDVRHRIIPDQVSSYAIPVGIVGAAALEWAGFEGWLAIGWRASVLGAAVWGGLFATFAVLGKFVTRQEVLGWGDVKLAAMFGAFLGVFPGTFVTVLVGSLFGAVVGIVATVVARRRVWLPYGPPLAVAAAGWVLWGDVLIATFFPGLAAFSR
ncbi:MAG: prepilin peptidase [Myxococcales bacterium]|nr:prepilin peptidase [Myxococcales bacterium]